jgi:uroporphyrinogen-III synthase
MSVKIKKILISQPEPTTEKSPYSELAEKYGVKFDFHQFIQVEGVGAKEFRNQRINILDHFAVVFTSKTGVDNFFRIVEELKIIIPETTKYFCVSESVAFYLQKYTIYRKRRIFYAGTGLFKDLITVMVKQKLEGGRFLLVLSDVYKAEIPQQMDKAKFKYTKGIFYKTVSRDLSSVDIKSYDILAFFSPQGIKSLFYNFPNFTQDETIIAAFGPTTAKAIKDAGLTLNIPVPTPEALSMPSALELYIKQQAKLIKSIKPENSAKSENTTAQSKKLNKQAKQTTQQPKKSAQNATKLAEKPATLRVKPVKLEVKPTKLKTKPEAKPATKSVKSATKSAKLVVAKSAKLKGKPTAKSAKPVAKPAKPVAKPAKSVAKPTKPAKPAKPVAKSAKPVAKSAKLAKPAVKPAKQTTKPVKKKVKPTKQKSKSR